MKIEEVLEKLDLLFENKDISGVEIFLTEKLEEALKEQDTGCVISILNELIGFYRDISEYERSLLYCEKVLNIMEQMGLTKEISFGTTLQNVANAYRAAGKFQESLKCYQRALPIYQELLPDDDMLIAGYYNNLSLLNQEMGDFKKACDNLTKALSIVESHPGEGAKLATTHGNLAVSLLHLNSLNQAYAHAKKSIQIFEQQVNMDFHYSISLSAMSDVCYQKGDYQEAITYYEKALYELESNVGRSQAYCRVFSNLQKCYEEIGEPDKLKGLSLAKEYYKTFGEPMIQVEFKEYEDRIAIGYVGEGSDCFGFDDATSIDHDFGPGFCMWLTNEDYDLFGAKLQEAYERLPGHLHGISRNNSELGKYRTGVQRIEEFYEGITGYEQGPSTVAQFLTIEEWKLATCTNGEVFKDSLGVFSAIRNRLKAHYNDEVFSKRMATYLTQMCQSGQYNVKRMLERQDKLGALYLTHIFIEASLKVVYLLVREYAPHDKWLFEGLRNKKDKPFVEEYIKGVKKLYKVLEAIENSSTQVKQQIEVICKVIVKELESQNLTQVRSWYLEDHARSIIENTIGKMVDKIVLYEWEAFDQVKNIGERASCQDDFSTFEIMRKSQYLTWNRPLLSSYLEDLIEARRIGRNLIMEKYARMMESTEPQAYETFKEELTPVPLEKQAIIDQIAEIVVEQMEAFKKEYPKMAMQARSIKSDQDKEDNTSYETYLKGELSTYSDKTLLLFGRFLANKVKTGSNLTKEIMNQTSLLYGYKNLEDAERRISCEL